MMRKAAVASPAVLVTKQQGLHGSARGRGVGRRRLLSFVFASTAAVPQASSDSNKKKKAILEKYLERSKENKEKYDKERLDDYYKRNYRDYFGFIEGSTEGKKDELMSESEKGIRKWLQTNK